MKAAWRRIPFSPSVSLDRHCAVSLAQAQMNSPAPEKSLGGITVGDINVSICSCFSFSVDKNMMLASLS